MYEYKCRGGGDGESWSCGEIRVRVSFGFDDQDGCEKSEHDAR